MLKRRIIAGIVVKDGWAVQSIGFHRYLPLGDPAIIAETLDRWQVDEIVLFDIDATPRGTGPDIELIGRVSAAISTPLTAAGGVRTVEDAHNVISNGADKVAINTAAFHSPRLVRGIADLYGRQCVVASIDVQRDPQGEARLFNRWVPVPSVDVGEFARTLADSGAGEILLNSVDRDGSKSGFDLELVRQVAAPLTAPLIVLGGAGKPEDIAEAMTVPGVAAVGAANFWTFSEHSVAQAKALCEEKVGRIRVNERINYRGRSVARAGRTMPPEEAALDRMVGERLQ